MASLVLTDAVWIDINPSISQNNLPDRLPDAHAVIYSGLSNLFACPVGARGRTFQPEYGSGWYKYLQEPIAPITAQALSMSIFQSVRRWEPRITLSMAQSGVNADTNLPGYKVRLGFYLRQGSNVLYKMQFDLKV